LFYGFRQKFCKKELRSKIAAQNHQLNAGLDARHASL
jgi:hypothetical protein